MVQKIKFSLLLYIIILKCEVDMMKNYFKGRHFQKDILLVAVGYYFSFNLSYRDVVEILRDRGITIHHTTGLLYFVFHHFARSSNFCREPYQPMEVSEWSNLEPWDG